MKAFLIFMTLEIFSKFHISAASTGSFIELLRVLYRCYLVSLSSMTFCRHSSNIIQVLYNTSTYYLYITFRPASYSSIPYFACRPTSCTRLRLYLRAVKRRVLVLDLVNLILCSFRQTSCSSIYELIMTYINLFDDQTHYVM